MIAKEINDQLDKLFFDIVTLELECGPALLAQIKNIKIDFAIFLEMQRIGEI